MSPSTGGRRAHRSRPTDVANAHPSTAPAAQARFLVTARRKRGAAHAHLLATRRGSVAARDAHSLPDRGIHPGVWGVLPEMKSRAATTARAKTPVLAATRAASQSCLGVPSPTHTSWATGATWQRPDRSSPPP